MTDTQKKEIRKLRSQGFGYKKISMETGISVNTVKTFCRRESEKEERGSCLFCGADMKSLPHKKEKRFCSDKCRYAWWSQNQKNRVSRPPYKHKCANCGKEFYSSRQGSKYCTSGCYSMARRKSGE